MPTQEELEQMHEAERSAAARASYITWRMRDLPSIYSQLMPPTYNAKVLWEAERCIRAQFEFDQKHVANPWKQLGPPCQLLDFHDMKPMEKIQFGLECTVPLGLNDAPKPGREDELADEIERQRAASPDYQRMVNGRGRSTDGPDDGNGADQG